jgi:U4/U6.U5 tri-snRNP-associated protein 2
LLTLILIFVLGPIHKIFQGLVRVSTEEKGKDNPEGLHPNPRFSSTEVPFMYLSLEIPPPPLFRDEQERNIIPQVPIFDLLAKFNGTKMTVRMK